MRRRAQQSGYRLSIDGNEAGRRRSWAQAREEDVHVVGHASLKYPQSEMLTFRAIFGDRFECNQACIPEAIVAAAARNIRSLELGYNESPQDVREAIGARAG
jgi:hypothetical protein